MLRKLVEWCISYIPVKSTVNRNQSRLFQFHFNHFRGMCVGQAFECQSAYTFYYATFCVRLASFVTRI